MNLTELLFSSTNEEGKRKSEKIIYEHEKWHDFESAHLVAWIVNLNLKGGFQSNFLNFFHSKTPFNQMYVDKHMIKK